VNATTQPLTNSLTAALVNVGLAKKPTQYEILWRFVKNEPGLTSAKLAVKTGLPRPTVNSGLSQMEKRAIVYTKGTKGFGYTGTAKAYYTDLDAYKLLPMPKVDAPKKFAPPASFPPADAAKAGTVQPAQAPTAFDLESLTIADARRLYNQLKGMFA